MNNISIWLCISASSIAGWWLDAFSGDTALSCIYFSALALAAQTVVGKERF